MQETAATIPTTDGGQVKVDTPAAANVQEVEQEAQAVVASAKGRRLKLFLMLLAGAIILYFVYRFVFARKNKNNMRGELQEGGADDGSTFSRTLGGIIDFDRSGDSHLVRDSGPGSSAGGRIPRFAAGAPRMPDAGLRKETAAALHNLAKQLKQANFTIQGQLQCPATRNQLDMFGPRGSAARSVIESIYIECRDAQLCPNIRAYPTWVSGDRRWEGFHPPNQLRNIANEMAQQQTRPMLQAPAEPNEVNLPDAQHLGETPRQMDPDMAKKMAYQILKEKKANAAAGQGAAIESDRSGAGVQVDPTTGSNIGNVNGDPKEGQGGTGCLDGAQTEAMHAEEDEHFTDGPEYASSGKARKEFVRGVTAFAPLNVPDMPGTAPMNLNVQHADFQNMQGNEPRASFENHEPMAELSRQVISSFNNLREHAARNPNAALYSQQRMPHSADITTGEAFYDKRVPYHMNPGSGE